MMAFWLLSITLYSQTGQKQISLLNKESALPIANATFKYDTQNGLSDQNGIIQFTYVEGAEMQLSHVNFGKWLLTDEEVKTAIRTKAIYRNEITVNLYPVTVIAVKPQNTQPKDGLKLESQDRLEHDAANILNQTPAFNSIRKGGNYGFEPVFRGFKYDQLNIVMNGTQSATAACPNRMDPPTSQMAPNMMNRIEVLKGPHALRYGTGFGATVNFIPTPLQFAGEPDFYGRLSSGYESNGNLRRGESNVGYRNDFLDFGVFASWSEGDDYTSGNGETVQADFSRGSFGANLGIKLDANQQLRLSATYNRARDADFPALPMDLRVDDTWMFNARHDIQIQGKNLQSVNTTLFGSFVDHTMNNLLKPLDPRMLNAETVAETYNYGGRTESVWQFGGNRLYAGLDLRVEGAEGIRTRDFLMGPMAGNRVEDNAWQEGEISKTGLFFEYQLKGTSFDYVFSGRMELNTATVNDPATEFSQINPDASVTQVNPSISAGILKQLGDKVQTSLWLARAQRSGSLTERFINYFPVGQDPFEMLGNPQLEAETNYQTDLNIKWQPQDGSVIQFDVFYAYLENYISSVIDETVSPRLPMSPGVRQFVNIDNAMKTGFEITWDQELVAGLNHRLGLAYTYGQDMERNEPLPEIAPLDLRYSIFGKYFKNRMRPEITFRYVAEQSRVSEEFGENVTPTFSLIDVKVGYKVTNSLSMNVGINNVFDENYFEHLTRSVRGTMNPIFAPGRNAFVNINVTF